VVAKVPPAVPSSSPPGATALAAGSDPLPVAKSAPAASVTAEPAQPARPKTYERLVGEADRLMENGQPARAQKLLDEALAMQPNGVAALSGVAYLHLDRHRPMAAISTFKRALGFSPEFAPALFGLAEAYRAQGEIGPAAENYRKYIAVAPGGPDAPAARRQLKDIESLMPKKPAPESAPAAPAKESADPAAQQSP
jgi:Tfp pilus assembly protein PilF